MLQLALDPVTNDLILSDKTGVERVQEGRYVVQNVRSRLKTVLNEYLLNPTLGWLKLEDFKKNYDLYDLESRAREIIISTPNVKSIDFMDLQVSKRVLTLTFQATTTFGTIDTTVPWEVL